MSEWTWDVTIDDSSNGFTVRFQSRIASLVALFLSDKSINLLNGHRKKNEMINGRNSKILTEVHEIVESLTKWEFIYFEWVRSVPFLLNSFRCCTLFGWINSREAFIFSDSEFGINWLIPKVSLFLQFRHFGRIFQKSLTFCDL